MKKFFTLLALPLLAITFVATSCPPSEPENLPAANSIFGDLPAVHVAQAGTLKAILAEKGLLDTTALKITGVLNLDDVAAFKGMMSYTPFTVMLDHDDVAALRSTTIADTLRTLDISRANVPDTFDLQYSQIEKIALPSAWTAIPDDFLRESRDLISVFIGDSVKTIGSNAFSSCHNLTSITIPEGVTSIGDHAFFYCTSLASITIPDGVTSIGEGAFASCHKLKNINIAAGNAQYVSENGAIFSKDKSRLIYFPTANGRYAIPESVTSIGAYAFESCYDLESITIPKGVTNIEKCTFDGCSGLVSITIPKGVTSIGDHAFFYCTSLASITIPESVTSIEELAFMSCFNLKNVTCLAATPPAINTIWGVFTGYDDNTLHVPAKSLAAYKANAAWREDFANIVAIAE